MKLVSENINQFTREGFPLEKMGIGQTELDKKFIEETDWDVNLDSDKPIAVVKLIRDFYGAPL